MSPKLHRDPRERGFVLITVMLLLALLMALIVAYYSVTHIEMSTVGSSMTGVRGLYAAEAGLNLRAQQVRAVFEGYSLPTGVPPDLTLVPCAGGNDGSGDFACSAHPLHGRNAETYVFEQPDSPTSIVVPRGEPFQNLHAQEYRYTVVSESTGKVGRPEAILEMRFKSRLIPMFQFMAFYNKDLEILPGPAMLAEGPVHTNGDLYVGSNASLAFQGQVTSAGDMYLGRKDTNTCTTGPTTVLDPANPVALPPCGGGRRRYAQSELDPWNGMVQTAVDTLTVPPPEELDPVPGRLYWDRADLRVMLKLTGGPPTVEVRQPGGGVDAVASATLAGCGSTGRSNTFHNNREGADIQMLEVDMRSLLDCIHDSGLIALKDVNDATDGGLVLYLGVDGLNSNAVNSYGVRVRNGAELAASDAMAPEVRGVTVVTNQAMYVQGDYNANDKKPASFLADSINILSGALNDAATHENNLANRVASNTTIQAAFLAGTDTTGGVEGAGGQGGAYNGGLENYPRLHEDWGGRTLRYRGSFVSLNTPRHVDGPWAIGGAFYNPPGRDWHYDTDFSNAANLPPLSPRFTHLRQELFQRQFERT